MDTTQGHRSEGIRQPQMPVFFLQRGPGLIGFGDGRCMERFKQFRFSIRTVPLVKGYLCTSVQLWHKGTGPVPVSASEKRFHIFETFGPASEKTTCSFSCRFRGTPRNQALYQAIRVPTLETNSGEIFGLSFSKCLRRILGKELAKFSQSFVLQYRGKIGT